MALFLLPLKCLCLLLVLTLHVVANKDSVLLAWECNSKHWREVFESVLALVASTETDYVTCEPADSQCMSKFRLLSYTAHLEGTLCPVAESVSRLAHLLLSLERDWHADMVQT